MQAPISPGHVQQMAKPPTPQLQLPSSSSNQISPKSLPRQSCCIKPLFGQSGRSYSRHESIHQGYKRSLAQRNYSSSPKKYLHLWFCCLEAMIEADQLLLEWFPPYLEDFQNQACWMPRKRRSRVSGCRWGSCPDVPGSDLRPFLPPKVFWRAYWRVELPPLRKKKKWKKFLLSLTYFLPRFMEKAWLLLS